MKIKQIALFSLIATMSYSSYAEWKPAPAPLTTEWGSKVTPDNVHQEYPRPQLVRPEWKNLNGLWEIAVGEGEASGLHSDIPTSFPQQILVPFPIESSLSGVGKRANHAWYKRTFEIPKDWADKKIFLNFEAVDYESAVYVNGQKVGTHKGGYDPFSFDITSHLKNSGPQEVMVAVFDPTDKGTQPRGKQVDKPHGIWYLPSTGIWQSVWLEPKSDVNISELHTEPNAKNNTLLIRTRINGDTDDVSVKWEISENGKSLADGTYNSLEDKDFRNNEFENSLPGKVLSNEVKLPENLKKWSPDSPQLYDLKLTVLKNGKKVDEISSYFGLRTIEVKKSGEFQRIFLNDKEIFQVGPLDQGFWPDGLHTPPSDEALKYDIEAAKKLGFNMIRKHIKVEPARWYYWCDKLGVLVWQDMPSGNTDADEAARKQYIDEYFRMIRKVRNSPSVVMWVIFNEGWGQFDKAGTAKLTDDVKKYDPMRLTNSASGWTDYGTGEIVDVHAYPGPGAPSVEADRASVLGEFGGISLKVDGHMWSKDFWGYQGSSNPDTLWERYKGLLSHVYWLKKHEGLNAAVYTQITDVEIEANGLITYDRKVTKVPAEKIHSANTGDIPALVWKDVVPTSVKTGQEWKYTTEKPNDGWFKDDFNAESWKVGKAPFATGKVFEVQPNTKIDWKEIWLKRTVDIPEGVNLDRLKAYVYHDDDVVIYINGVEAVKVQGRRKNYIELDIKKEALDTIKPGKNTISVSCINKNNEGFLDVGLVEMSFDENKKAKD